jgi:hypothetical protein
MSALIEAFLVQTGFNLYANVRDKSGQLWNGTAFEAFTSGNYATYAITLTEQTSTGYYKVAFPSSIGPGKYTYAIYQRAGGSPALGDQIVYQSQIFWDGTNEITPLSTNDVLTQINTALNTVISSPTSGSILADVQAIFNKLPTGSISGFNRNTDTVNLSNNQSGVTIGIVNDIGSTAASTIKSQVDASVGSDAIPELVGVPSSTPTLKTAMMFLLMALRNKRTSDATTEKIYNASGAVIATAPQSDNGTTFTKDNFS